MKCLIPFDSKKKKAEACEAYNTRPNNRRERTSRILDKIKMHVYKTASVQLNMHRVRALVYQETN